MAEFFQAELSVYFWLNCLWPNCPCDSFYMYGATECDGAMIQAKKWSNIINEMESFCEEPAYILIEHNKMVFNIIVI